MIHLVCYHGWGLEPSFWQPMITEFSRREVRIEFTIQDEGYFDSQSPAQAELPQSPTWIAVGHSLGFAKLLDAIHEHSCPPAGLISINGFTRFCKTESKPTGTDLRVLRRMQRGFEREPHSVLDQFKINCGLPIGQAASKSHAINHSRLAADLSLLQSIDQSKRLNKTSTPTLVLAGRADSIVPPELTESCFKPQQTAWHESAQHAIPANHYQWCVDQILDFIFTTTSLKAAVDQ